MYLIVSKVLVVFEGAVELEDENVQPVMLVEGDTELSTTEGAVASASGDSTVTDEAILRGADVVVHVPQSSEPDTTLVVEEGETSQVVADSSNSPNSGPSETYRRVSFGCLNSLLGATDCTNHTCYFSLDLVCTDFEPYTGDCVEVIFSTDPDTQSRRAVSVKPRVYKHVSEHAETIHGMSFTVTFYHLNLKDP
uniref:Uncharacterized protein n=1 Tax=Oryctolagus cuniculus TaxID=9986 RepID=A0A5F9CV82_RABIT